MGKAVIISRIAGLKHTNINNLTNFGKKFFTDQNLTILPKEPLYK